MVHHFLWKNKYHLLGYWATKLRKIQVITLKSTALLFLFSIIHIYIRHACPPVYAYYSSFKWKLTSSFFWMIIFSDFFSWNRIKIRYCDGASFSGDSQNAVRGDASSFSPLTSCRSHRFCSVEFVKFVKSACCSF